MDFVNNILYYIALFFALCMFVVILIAIYNIVTKSFKPKNSLLLLSALLVFFLISATLTLTNLSDAVRFLGGSSSDGGTTITQPRNTTPRGANF